MNLFFKRSIIFYLFFDNVFAISPITITYAQNFETADLVQEILINQQGIPSELINLKWQIPACSPIASVVMQLCINDSDELEIINVNHKRLEESYKIFSTLSDNKKLLPSSDVSNKTQIGEVL